MGGTNEALESRIREAWDRGDYDTAADVAIRGYGIDVYKFLLLRMRKDDQADEVFGQLGEDLWKGLPRFGWRCSFLTWMYTLARNAANRYDRSPANQAKHFTPLSNVSAQYVAEVKEQTADWVKSSVKDQFAELGRQLPPEDRALLHFRVYDRLAWNDVAKIMEADPTLSGEELERASARMRQRFKKLKERLREMAIERGILVPRDADDES